MKSHPIQQDLSAVSADPCLPAFLARPEGSPIYHGFDIISESETDGWTYGAISGYETSEPETEGDGFVITPDGKRAGIAWATDTPDFYEILPPNESRWGVYGVRFPKPVRSKQDLIDCFRHVLPLLKKRYKEIRNT